MRILHPGHLIKFVIPYLPYLITLASLQQESCWFGLTRIPYSWCFLLVIFHPLTPPSSLAINPHVALFLKLSPVSLSYCKTPVAQVPSWIVFFTIFNKCHEIFSINNHQSFKKVLRKVNPRLHSKCNGESRSHQYTLFGSAVSLVNAFSMRAVGKDLFPKCSYDF